MKIIFFTIAVFFLITSRAFAASPKPTIQNPLPTDDLTRQIEQKVASTVARLNLVEKRGIVGIVTDSNDRQITINDLSENTRIIDVDEFTKFSSSDKSSSFGISDIKKGNQIGVLGLYNKQSRRTLARFITVMDIPEYITGIISSKDSKNFTLQVATGKENTKVSIENITKTYDVDSTGKLIKSGFTKISIGENITVSGFFDPKDKTTITAKRIFLFPGIPQNPTIEISTAPTLAPSSSIVPSTGSGLKLTPIIK
jgi:hypothetical protein